MNFILFCRRQFITPLFILVSTNIYCLAYGKKFRIYVTDEKKLNVGNSDIYFLICVQGIC